MQRDNIYGHTSNFLYFFAISYQMIYIFCSQLDISKSNNDIHKMEGAEGRLYK